MAAMKLIGRELGKIVQDICQGLIAGFDRLWYG